MSLPDWSLSDCVIFVLLAALVIPSLIGLALLLNRKTLP